MRRSDSCYGWWLPISLLIGFLSWAATAAPMPLEQARRLIESGQLDEVFLAFAATFPGAHPEGDGAAAAMLVEAARAALKGEDAVLALGFADAARRLDDRSVEACLIAADAAIAVKQRGAAEEALDAAVRLAPTRWDVVLRRAVFAEEEGQPEKALELLARVPKSAPEHAEVARRALKLSAELAAQAKALKGTRRLEAEAKRRQELAAKQAGRNGSAAPAASVRSDPYDSGTGGMIARQSDHFRILYSSGDRDFAQKAAYEQKVLDIFENAYHRVGQKLGHHPERPVDVVLYTAEEFELHFGGAFGGALLGFYAGKIRMNRSERIDHGFNATAVHEYVHAAVDSLASYQAGRVPMWLNEGLARWLERAITGGDYLSFGEREALRAALRQGRSPSLAELAEVEFGRLGGTAHLAYSRSSAAVQALVGTGGGLPKVSAVIRGVGRGKTFAQAFADAFGPQRLGSLDAEVDALIR